MNLTAPFRRKLYKAVRKQIAMLSSLLRISSLAMAFTACTPLSQPACQSNERYAVQETLYFGTAQPGRAVTTNEWTEFLKVAVTPRFPLGFSVWPASGQWRSAAGTILQESSHVLSLIHPDNRISETAVLAIIDQYKSQFRQEAVLRVKNPACVSF